MTILRCFVRSAVLSLLLTSWCSAEDPKPSAPPAVPAAASTRPAGLDALIAQLGADEWKTRDAAAARIVEIGEDAVKPMEELAAKSPDAEVQQRARSILGKIAAASLTKPTLVTLKFENAPMREVYESLYKQVDAKLVVWPPSLFENPVLLRARAGPAAVPKGVTINLEKVPFWTAMQELQKQTGLMIDTRMPGEMRLVDAQFAGRPGGRDAKACINGPFMVIAGDELGGGMVHELKVFVEPRMHVLSHARMPQLADEAANAGPGGVEGKLRARMQAARMGREFDGSSGNAFNVRFDFGAVALDQLKGSVRAKVVTREQTVTIDGVAEANNVERIVDGRRFLLNAMNPEPNDWMIIVIAYNTIPPTPGLEQMRITLADAAGSELTLGGHSSNSSEKRADFHLQFRQGPNCGPPAKLTMTLPTETREIEIPFDFTAKPEGGGAAGAKR